MTRIEIATFEPADSVVIPTSVLARAGAQLDEAAARRRREVEARAADATRMQNTRRARAARRLRQALNLLGGAR
jgi:hypothetical protein